MADSQQAGAGRTRVLVVEDEALLALMLRDMLEDLGYDVEGPVGRIDQALATAGAAPIDAAILDLNLGGDSTFEVADRLLARGVPFVFATGYAESALPERFRQSPTLRKPFQGEELARALEGAMRRATGG